MYQSEYSGAEIDAGIKFTQEHNTDAESHDDIRTRINSLGAELARSATIVVAANNSKYKQYADFVCSGANDQNTILSAYNVLPQEGGTIQLLEGTYNFNGGVRFQNGKNVYIKGAGMHTTILKADPSFEQFEGALRWYTAKGGLADLCIDANGDGTPDFGAIRAENEIIVQNILLKNYQGSRQALYITLSHCKILNCFFENNNSALGFSTLSAHNIALGNTFIQNTTHINDMGTDNIIENNYIEGVV